MDVTNHRIVHCHVAFPKNGKKKHVIVSFSTDCLVKGRTREVSHDFFLDVLTFIFVESEEDEDEIILVCPKDKDFPTMASMGVHEFEGLLPTNAVEHAALFVAVGHYLCCSPLFRPCRDLMQMFDVNMDPVTAVEDLRNWADLCINVKIPRILQIAGGDIRNSFELLHKKVPQISKETSDKIHRDEAQARKVGEALAEAGVGFQCKIPVEKMILPPIKTTSKRVADPKPPTVEVAKKHAGGRPSREKAAEKPKVAQKVEARVTRNAAAGLNVEAPAKKVAAKAPHAKKPSTTAAKPSQVAGNSASDSD